MRTIVYVDGFNLYYRALRRFPGYKWLNLQLLAEEVLIPVNKIQRINYYTAHVTGKFDQQAPVRQRTYLSALETVPLVKVHHGNFLAKKAYAPLVAASTGSKPVFQPWPSVVRIIKTEEKGSDVNLASHLVYDACKDNFDVAVVISNDTDLIEPIRLSIQDLNKIVGVICPDQAVAAGLQNVASFVRYIRAGHLAKAQFPNRIARPNQPPLDRPVEWA